MKSFKPIISVRTMLLAAGMAVLMIAGFDPAFPQTTSPQATQTTQAETTQAAITPAEEQAVLPAGESQTLETAAEPEAPKQSNTQTLMAQFKETIVGYLPRTVGALAVLVVGWLLAMVVAGGVRRVMKRTKLDDKLSQWTTSEEGAMRFDMAGGVAKVVYYLIMLFVVVGVFQALRLTELTAPINRFLGRAFEYVPQIIGAGILLLVAWVIASLIRLVVTKVLTATKIDEKFSQQAGTDTAAKISLSKAVASFLYWLVFLLFLPAILGTLGMQGLLEPVQGMLNQILAALPNILAAGLIFLIGWFIARIVSRIVTNLLAAVGTDKAGEKIGLKGSSGKHSPSQLIGTLVYALIIIPAIIAALNALQIDAISRPSTEMLTTIMNAIPSIFAAALVLVIAYIVGRLVKGLVTNILSGIGFNNLPAWLGFSTASLEGERAPSAVLGYVAMVAIMLFAVIEAAQLLGFSVLADLATTFVYFGGKIILALAVFGVGLYLANLAHRLILGAGNPMAELIAQLARIAIIFFVAAMALRQMEIAPDIIKWAFIILLGAIAVALAIAFGIGSREIAGRQVEKWLKKTASAE